VTGLDDLRERIGEPAIPKSRKKKADWMPLTPIDLRSGTVLALDQSLGAAGFVLVTSTPSFFTVHLAGTLATDETTVRGHEQSLLRGVEIYQSMTRLVTMACEWSDRVVFLHETPPVGGTMARPESSLLSALAFRIALSQRNLVPMMVGAQSAKRLICGNANATKREAHAKLAEYAPWINGYDLVTNEGRRDALMLALYHLANRDEHQ
jgi:Holliday junction resolvasome RuvABC endonuclease subunit